MDELKLENVVDKEENYKEILEKDSFDEIVKNLNKEDRDIFYRVYYLAEDISDIAKVIGKKLIIFIIEKNGMVTSLIVSKSDIEKLNKYIKKMENYYKI